jgi:hypothetical protein
MSRVMSRSPPSTAVRRRRGSRPTRRPTLTVQLANQTEINSVTVTRGSTSSFGYSVETSSDGSTWHVVGTAPASSTGTDTIKFGATQAQYVRLDFPGGTGAGTPDIAEVAVNGP